MKRRIPLWHSKWLARILVIALITFAGSWLVARDIVAPDVASSPSNPVAVPIRTPAAGEIPARSAVLLTPDTELIQPSNVASTPGQRPIPAQAGYSARAMATPSAPVFSADPEVMPARTTAPERAAQPWQGLFPPATGHPRHEGTVGAVSPVIVPPVPTRGFRMPMEEPGYLPGWRRDTRLGGPRRYMSPWFSAYNDNLERDRDGRSAMLRRQGYLDRHSDGGWMDTICPWSNPRHDWPARRGYGWQMKQRNRQQGYRDSFKSQPPFGLVGRARR